MPDLRGDEQFRADGAPLGFTLLDYWRWSSDLLGNAERGVLAEFLIANALGVLGEPRIEWADHDVTTLSGCKVEVKSAAYFQTWHQERPSLIGFDIAPRKQPWDPKENQSVVLDSPKRSAAVYVFCVLGSPDGSKPDPFDLDQWDFYVLATATLNRELQDQKTISLNPLRQLVEKTTGRGAIKYADLRQAIEAACP